ncbi:MAG: YkgJ family cysteine cluster protein [Spirochaetales bacterium]|nr:YkgJ family cysteine cluster protein [Spirochaetales bacterium]
MICRPGCAACCTVISISSPLPGMAGGKPAGTACVNLDREGRCLLHGTAAYPKVCREFTPTREICGLTNDHARRFLRDMERLTGPSEADKTGNL